MLRFRFLNPSDADSIPFPPLEDSVSTHLPVLEGGVPSLQDTYSGALLSREIVCFLNPELLDYRIVIRERKFYIKVIGFIGQMVLLTVN